MTDSTGLDLYEIQNAIKEYLETVFPAYVVSEGAIPTAESLPFVNGKGDPFLIIRFSDSMPAGDDKSFYGPTRDGYYSYFSVLCFADNPDDVRKLASVVTRRFLGKKFANAGAIAKNFGGGAFVILADTRQPAAYVLPSNFRFTFNQDDVGAGSLVV